MASSRRISLPVPNRLSPGYGYLKEIHEFDVEPPFISPFNSSSSSCDASPKMLSPLRPASARPYRRRHKFQQRENAWPAMDYDDFDDGDDSPFFSSASPSPSPQPIRSARYSSRPPSGADGSECSSSPGTNGLYAQNDENRNEFFGDYFVPEAQTFEDKLAPLMKPAIAPQKIRSFNVDAHGKILDCGFRTGRPSRPLQRNNKNRRATCPEIWLSAADEDFRPVTRCALRMYGATNVGKRTLTRQMSAHADPQASLNINGLDSMDEASPPVNTQLAFMINDAEIQLEIVQGSAPEQTVHPFDDQMTIFMVMYSVDSRESFVRAAQILYRLHDSRRAAHSSVPVILVANKVDLQRKRKVSFIEGKMLAKIYKSSFVEASSLLSMNLDQVWEETLRKIQKCKAARDRQLQKQFGAEEKEGHGRLMGRIMKQGRRFAKSCEEIVARLASL